MQSTLVNEWRRDTPACAHRLHLNNAGAALMPRAVVDAMTGHLALEQEMGGYEAADLAADRISDVYRRVAALIGGQARNIAIVQHATMAFTQAMAAFDFTPGDRIVTSQADYVSHQIAFLALAKRRGVEVCQAADGPDGSVEPGDVHALASHPRCRLVSICWMPTNSGLVQDVHAVGEVCQELDVPYLVDACQAVGQRPIDVAALRCDFLTATARKFLRGPRGIGFLYVSDRALARGLYPSTIDMNGASWSSADAFELVDSARRFEQWELPYALVLGLGEAADYAMRVGLDTAAARAPMLAARLRAQLAAVPGWRVLDDRPNASAIVAVELGAVDPRPVVEALRRQGINTSATFREWARYHMGRQGVEAALRVSPHYYNTEDEIDRFVPALYDVTRTL
ncbi:MAG TPA: aminotransferase class V-fold PLP-dependent enzyme [Vicinamibacterales bacterium]|nr:aminotransferase class V-fold PLP-dependent enzyme [Vicinamibacterales bacterium]